MLRQLITATGHIVATCNDHQAADAIVDRSQVVLQRSALVVREVRKALQTPNDHPRPTKLPDAGRDLLSILNTCLSNMPNQRVLDEAMKQMSEYVYTLAGPFDRKQPTSAVNSEDLNRAADKLQQATTDLVVSTRTGTTNDLATTSSRFSQAFGDFLHNGIDHVHHQQEDEKRSHLIISLKNVHSSSNQLLERAKSLSIEPASVENDTKQQLANAAR